MGAAVPKSPPPRAGEGLALEKLGIRLGLLTRRTQFFLDLVALTASFLVAYLLRFDFAIPKDVRGGVAFQLPFVILVQIIALALAGVYSFIWRYVGMHELRAFVYAFFWSALALTALRLTLPDRYADWRVPLSVILMGTALGFMAVLGLRLARRALWEREEKRRRRLRASSGEHAPTLFFGAGEAGRLAAREIEGRTDTNLDVRGFIDDDINKQGTLVHGIPVIGTRADLPRLVKELGITQVVITISQISREEILRLMSFCQSIPVACRIVPGFSEILEGKVKVSRIRDIKVEDLLGRPPARFDEGAVRTFLDGKTVMVTGAGGSIGSELSRQVARLSPARLLLVERAEFALFDTEQEILRMLRSFHEIPIVALVADVGDLRRMEAVFSEYQPEVVIHAAAHKHVPLMESNSAEAIKNNVFGSRRLGELAGRFGAEAFVFVSTDKAVRPTSVMGASKRVAELALQELSLHHRTRFVAVRFGNVMDSAGSVIPTFRQQVRSGGPVTVTHPDIKRYFMTIPEASQLVLEAGAMGQSGEILVLEMGEQVPILDLAVALIKQTGLKPYDEMPIMFTGLRPGEKLFEEIEMRGEEMTKTRNPRIYIGKLANVPSDRLQWALAELEMAACQEDDRRIRQILSEFLPEARLEMAPSQRRKGRVPGRKGGEGPRVA
jgi:FlaA1/EpsC-like NDP-sugar epimerase